MKATALAPSIAPSALAALFVAASLVGLRAEPEATSALHDALRPEHRKALETSEADLKAQLDTLAASETDAETAKAIADIRDLLALPRKEILDQKSLLGNWRVRSLQVSDLGAYAYPFFQCTIRRDGPSGIVFKKDSGSQRRMGPLARDGKNRFLFLGGSYYTYDKAPLTYSTLQDDHATRQPDRDSAGHLFQLGGGHLLLVFASEEGRGEIYELRK